MKDRPGRVLQLASEKLEAGLPSSVGNTPQTRQASAILLLASTSAAVHATPVVALSLSLSSRHDGCGPSTIDRQRHRQHATEPASDCHPPAGVNLRGRPLRPLRSLSLPLSSRHDGCGPSTTDRQGRRPPPRAADPRAPSILPPLSLLEQSNEERITRSWRLD